MIDKGVGCHIWDVEGKKYLDFFSSFGSANQGHTHPEILKVMIEQAHKIQSTTRAYYNSELGEFAEYLCNLLGYDKFMPANGGCEGCEGAVKAARRWGYTVKGVESNKATVIMAKNNFWGRSITASGASDDPFRYKDFGPYTDAFPLVEFNNLKALED